MVKNQNKFYYVGIEYFISIKGPIILQNYPILSPSEPDQLIQLSGNREFRFWCEYGISQCFPGLH